MQLEPVTQDIAAALGMARPMGSIVDGVHAGGPAAIAGLRIGDVILRYDNHTPSDERALMRAIAKSTIGQAVPITMLRAGQAQNLLVTPAEWPGTVITSAAVASQAPEPTVRVPPNLGISLSTLTAELRARQGLHMQQAGVLVEGVAAGTDAFDRGLAPGDVILRVQDTDVGSPQEVTAAVDAARTQHKAFVLALVLAKVQQSPGARWMALRVTDGVDARPQ